ncbi:hypothetical protein G7Z17_g1458 [Cylindrodendrum hubeiense]|uniref:Uncharacterized protein n=1 Tax=Cylindrodendrum hubeiense TaxID=595255 RepID=A0A9P5HKS3_9HYPO|nr:hypothetical protein G7Z17_g1458 [Cylindrodendrum hubeiense]
MYPSMYLWAWIIVGANALACLIPKDTTEKPVFAHYMVGTVENEHCRKDIVDAQNLGIDAFAVNFNQYASWSNTTVDRLFDNADELGFKIFFSFDMSGSYFSDPGQYAEYLGRYLTRTSYYTYKDVPLLSTFGGELVTGDQWKGLRNEIGNILIIPSFYEATPSSTFFNEYSELDGIFNWNSWPKVTDGKVVVSAADDITFQTAAKSAKAKRILNFALSRY